MRCLGMLVEPIPAGPSAGRGRPRADAREYYAARGWDADGRPTGHKLAELSLRRDAGRCTSTRAKDQGSTIT
jgi:aldehyde:ferredoxin oxidoreductase